MTTSGLTKIVTAIGLAALALGSLPAVASAESEQFASPTGKATGDCRIKSSPCSLTHAVERASTRDTVFLLPGRYTVAAGLWPQQSVNFAGAPGSMPVVDFGRFTMAQVSAAHPLAVGALDVYGSNIQNIKFVGESDDAPILNFDDASAGTLDNSSIRGYMDRVVVEGSGSATPLAMMGGLRNSIVTTSNAPYALEGVGSVIGSTVINTRSLSAAIRVMQTREPSGLEQLHSSLYVRNSIVRGQGGAENVETIGPSIDIDWSDVEGTGDVAVSVPPASATITVGAHMTTADPGFVSATDLALQSSSPLIDAGASAQDLGLASLSEITAKDLGVSDVFGNRRIRAGSIGGQLAVPDVGGIEFQPPTPTVSVAKVSAKKARAGTSNAVSFRLSGGANIQIFLQRVQRSRATNVASRKAKLGAGTASYRFLLKAGRKKLAKGQYRFAITPTSLDGVAGKVAYVPFKVV